MKKFTTLLEGVFRRYQGGDFLTGDIVKIKADALNSDWAKSQEANALEALKQFMESDLNLRVSSVKALRPAVQGSTQQDEQTCDFYVDVVQETAPGRWHSFITVPAVLLELANPDTPNLAPVPDSLKKADPSHIEPEEVKDESKADGDTRLPGSQTRYTDHGDGKLSKSDTEMTQGDKGKKAEPMKATSYTSVYLTGR
jgi:hypothetical protein